MRPWLCVLWILLSGCTRAHFVDVESFTATPVRFCRVPQPVTLTWVAIDNLRTDSARLSASPATPDVATTGTPVVLAGTRTTLVQGTTLFTASVLGAEHRARTATVTRIEEDQAMVLECIATCTGTTYTCTVDVSRIENTDELVIRRVRNEGSESVQVQGPAGGVVSLMPGESSGELGGSRFAGLWALRAQAPPGYTCTPTSGAPERTLRAEVVFGCQ